MPEIVADLEPIVVLRGREYYGQVVAEQRPGGSWEAWLEFVPLADDQDILMTKTETTQPTREDVTRWAAILTPVYVEGALSRAVPGSGAQSTLRQYEGTVREGRAPFDPFDLLQLVGKDALRARLRALARSELLTIIHQHGLNPAGKSLARLSDSQLATFIVTAVEVQAARGRR